MWAWLAVPHLYRTSREGRILLPTQNLREQQADRLRAAAGPPGWLPPDLQAVPLIRSRRVSPWSQGAF